MISTSHMELLEMKNTISEMKSMPYGIKNTLDTVDEKISELEAIVIETSHVKHREEKLDYKNKTKNQCPVE